MLEILLLKKDEMGDSATEIIVELMGTMIVPIKMEVMSSNSLLLFFNSDHSISTVNGHEIPIF